MDIWVAQQSGREQSPPPPHGAWLGGGTPWRGWGRGWRSVRLVVLVVGVPAWSCRSESFQVQARGLAVVLQAGPSLQLRVRRLPWPAPAPAASLLSAWLLPHVAWFVG